MRLLCVCRHRNMNLINSPHPTGNWSWKSCACLFSTARKMMRLLCLCVHRNMNVIIPPHPTPPTHPTPLEHERERIILLWGSFFAFRGSAISWYPASMCADDRSLCADDAVSLCADDSFAMCADESLSMCGAQMTRWPCGVIRWVYVERYVSEHSALSHTILPQPTKNITIKQDCVLLCQDY